jgi:hypothetical protein
MRPPLIVVCMPVRDHPTDETAQALRDHLDGYAVRLLTEVGRPVREARNALARRIAALDVPHETPVLWIDDDAWWPPGSVAALASRLPAAGVSFGLQCVRAPWSLPSGVPADLQPWSQNMELRANAAWSYRGPVRDRGAIVPVLVASTHCFMHRAGLLADRDEPFTPAPAVRARLAGAFENVVEELTDDASFCLNMLDAGVPLGVDTAVTVAHVERETQAAFVPLREAMRVRRDALVPCETAPAAGKDRVYGLAAYDGGRSAEDIVRFLARTAQLFVSEGKRLGLTP